MQAIFWKGGRDALGDFDTHQRMDMIRRFLEHLFPEAGQSHARILDVGGFPATLSDGLSDRLQVVTVDTQIGPLLDYVCASGAALPFETGSFDAVVGSDVLEHVAEEKREDFLKEMGRVSRGWVLLGGPFLSPDVQAAEAAVEKLTESVQGKPNKWLREHIENGLPSLNATRGRLAEMGFVDTVVPNGSLFSWVLLKETEMLLEAIPNGFKQYASVNDLYMRFWSEFDHQRPTYRHLIVANRDMGLVEQLILKPPLRCGLELFGPDTQVLLSRESAKWIAGLAHLFEELVSFFRKEPTETGEKDEAQVKDTYIKMLETIVGTQERQRTDFEEEIRELKKQLAKYEGSRFVRLWKNLRKA